MSSPLCSACNVERKLTAVEAFAKGYDVQSLECPVCHTVVTLVVRREATPLKEVEGHA
jgi:hypothetical protein